MIHTSLRITSSVFPLVLFGFIFGFAKATASAAPTGTFNPSPGSTNIPATTVSGCTVAPSRQNRWNVNACNRTRAEVI
jgi:hypothetical protein